MEMEQINMILTDIQLKSKLLIEEAREINKQIGEQNSKLERISSSCENIIDDLNISKKNIQEISKPGYFKLGFLSSCVAFGSLGLISGSLPVMGIGLGLSTLIIGSYLY